MGVPQGKVVDGAAADGGLHRVPVDDVHANVVAAVIELAVPHDDSDGGGRLQAGNGIGYQVAAGGFAVPRGADELHAGGDLDGGAVGEHVNPGVRFGAVENAVGGQRIVVAGEQVHVDGEGRQGGKGTLPGLGGDRIMFEYIAGNDNEITLVFDGFFSEASDGFDAGGVEKRLSIFGFL